MRSILITGYELEFYSKYENKSIYAIFLFQLKKTYAEQNLSRLKSPNTKYMPN